MLNEAKSLPTGEAGTSSGENGNIEQEIKEIPNRAVRQQLKPKSKIRKFILGILIVLVLGVLSNYFWNYIGAGQWHRYVGIPYDTVGNPINGTNQTATSNWKTYKNSQYGFSFKYPDTRPFEIEEFNEIVRLTRLSDDVIDPVVIVEQIECNSNSYPKTETNTPITNQFREDTKSINVLSPSGKCYKISRRIYLPKVMLQKDNNLISQILSTFKFTK